MWFMRNDPPNSGRLVSPRYDAVSTIGLAALVAALHLATIAGRAGRVSVRHPQITPVTRMETLPPAETRRESDRAPSNPTRSYSAGRLALTVGMVIVALAYQLHVMHVGTARSR
jgi:hypothetical protein